MPNIYDNSTGKILSDAIETALTNAESLDACIGYFNLRGWRTLDRTIDELRPKNREKARILIGMLDRPDQTVLQSLRLSAVRGNRLIYDGEVMANELDSVIENFAGQLVSGIPNGNDKKALVRLSNQLRSGEVVIKAYLAQRLHAKLYLANRGNDAVTPRVAFVGSSNLTLAGLEGQGELNIDVHDQDATTKLSLWFDDKWDDINAFDISATLADLIDSSWINQADPFLVYLKFAYFLSHEAREGNSIVEIPRDIEPLLLDFQKSAVKTATRILQRNNGVMIADVVGLGKTLTATAIARVMEEAENVETLIICPKNLEDMWQEYVRAYKLRGARVIPLSMARTELGDLGRYRLVIIDESHNLRNAGGQTYNAVREYIAKNEPRVVLLTATPYNINLTDIADQLSLFIGDEQLLQVKPDLAIQAAGGYFNFSKLTRGAAPNSMKAFRKSEYVEDWRSLLQYYMVRRTREFVKKNYASTDSNGKKYLMFPNNPSKKLYFPDRIPHFLEMKDVEKEEREVIDAATLAGNLKLARQGLGNYLLPSSANLDDELIRDIKGQKQTLQGLTRTNLVKRRSSSPAAFSLTLQRHLIRDFAFLHAIKSNCPLPIGAGSLLDGDTTLLKPDELIDVNENISDKNVTLLSIAADGSVGHISLSEASTLGRMAYEKIALRKPDQIRWADLLHFDIKRLQDDLSSDIDAIYSALEAIGIISPIEDSKLDLLFNEVIKKNEGKKVLIFSEYQDTVDYVANSLKSRFKLSDIESVNSGTTDIQKVVRRFSPKSNSNIGGLPLGELEIQYLVSTDVLSEGQNLQDASIIANFDLPWALIKLVQRAGRVDRLGQESDRVDVYVIDPSAEANRQIGLRQRLQARLIEAGAVIGGDDRFFGSDLEAQAISDILTGNSNLEADDPQDVDPASYAYEIWRKGIEEFPQVKNLVVNLPLSSRSTIKSKNQLLNGRVYALTVVSGQHNISSYVTMDGLYHSISPIEILLKTKCEYGGLPEEELSGHLDALQIIADGSIESVGQGTVAMAGTRKALYEAVKDHARLVEGSLFTDNEARMALQAIYNLPMTEVAKAVFSQGIRNADPSELIDKMVALYNEGALVIEESGSESGSLQFIGSIGINGAKK
jgi:superfamily II DNA or RNA helicase